MRPLTTILILTAAAVVLGGCTLHAVAHHPPRHGRVVHEPAPVIVEHVCAHDGRGYCSHAGCGHHYYHGRFYRERPDGWVRVYGRHHGITVTNTGGHGRHVHAHDGRGYCSHSGCGYHFYSGRYYRDRPDGWVRVYGRHHGITVTNTGGRGNRRHVHAHNGRGRCNHCTHYYFRGSWHVSPPPGWHVTFHN